MSTDYLIVGSGLCALVFGALMARSGRRVTVLEAHDVPGGFGHTFSMGRAYRFNAQLHYVWNCGEGDTVQRTLQHLGLDREVSFERFDPAGFDHMRMPGYALDIPGDPAVLRRRLGALFPAHSAQIGRFLEAVELTRRGLDSLGAGPAAWRHIDNWRGAARLLAYRNATLQQVFDRCALPRAAQTLLALQWPDFMLPPARLSFCAWVLLFTGYQRGAYYPTRHFEHVVDSLAEAIVAGGGRLLYQREVVGFELAGRRVTGVTARQLPDGGLETHRGRTVICNMDPQRAAGMIGLEAFSPRLRRRLTYRYSASNFMAYCAVKDIDLAAHGFGRWNVFHSGDEDLNVAFARMLEQRDYRNPSFAMSTPGFLTGDRSDRPEGQQIIEFLTVADYDYFQQLRQRDKTAYRRKKREILDAMIAVVEAHYVPDFRRHLAFRTSGTPATNERFCWCPQGNSYGSEMTPQQFGLGRLRADSSLRDFYFCNASSGYPGFAGAFWTGARLYEKLAGERVL